MKALMSNRAKEILNNPQEGMLLREFLARRSNQNVAKSGASTGKEAKTEKLAKAAA